MLDKPVISFDTVGTIIKVRTEKSNCFGISQAQVNMVLNGVSLKFTENEIHMKLKTLGRRSYFLLAFLTNLLM